MGRKGGSGLVVLACVGDVSLTSSLSELSLFSPSQSSSRYRSLTASTPMQRTRVSFNGKWTFQLGIGRVRLGMRRGLSLAFGPTRSDLLRCHVPTVTRQLMLRVLFISCTWMATSTASRIGTVMAELTRRRNYVASMQAALDSQLALRWLPACSRSPPPTRCTSSAIEVMSSVPSQALPGDLRARE